MASVPIVNPLVTRTAPSASKLFTRVSRLSLSRTGASASAASPTGMLTKKIHSQESASVSTPPRRTPAAAPKPPTAPQTPSAMFRSPALCEGRHQDRERRRRDRRGAESLNRAGADQRRLGPGEPAEQRADRERDQPDHEDPPAPEDVRGAAAEQQEAAEDERVGGDHPLQVGLRESEIRLDRGEGNVHDRDVEHDHELHGGEKRQCEPFQVEVR